MSKEYRDAQHRLNLLSNELDAAVRYIRNLIPKVEGFFPYVLMNASFVAALQSSPRSVVSPASQDEVTMNYPPRFSQLVGRIGDVRVYCYADISNDTPDIKYGTENIDGASRNNPGTYQVDPDFAKRVSEALIAVATASQEPEKESLPITTEADEAEISVPVVHLEEPKAPEEDAKPKAKRPKKKKAKPAE